MDSTFPSQSMASDVCRRVQARWPLKFAGVTGFIAVFFVGYFMVLRFPVFPVTPMPVTALDDAIPFQPAMLVVYLSLWLYVSIPSALLTDFAELRWHATSAGVLALAGLTIFFFWPTAVVPGHGAGMGAASGLAWLKTVDAAGNACPSLHVAFAVFGALWLDRGLMELRSPAIYRGLNVVWCAGIVYSTLATKQHVVLDVIAGLLLGLPAGLARPRLRESNRRILAAR